MHCCVWWRSFALTFIANGAAEFNDNYLLEGADVQYTEPAFIAYLKGEDTHLRYPNRALRAFNM